MLVQEAAHSMFGAPQQPQPVYRVTQFGGQQAAAPAAAAGLPTTGGGCGGADYPRVADLGVGYQPERFDFLSRLSHNGPDDAKARPNDAMDYMRLRWSANSNRLSAPASGLAARGGWFSQMRSFAGVAIGPPRMVA